MKENKLLILGVGSFFAGDDVAGLEVIRWLKKMLLPSCVTLKEVNAPGIDILDELRGFEEAWIVDAIDAGKKGGEIIFADLSEFQFITQKIASLHGLSLNEVLELANFLLPEDMPSKIKILGIQKASIEGGKNTLSTEVAAAIPKAVEIILKEIKKGCWTETA